MVLRSSGRSWVIHWDLDAEGNASSDVDLDGNDSGEAFNPDHLMLLPDDTPRQVRPPRAGILLNVFPFVYSFQIGSMFLKS